MARPRQWWEIDRQREAAQSTQPKTYWQCSMSELVPAGLQQDWSWLRNKAGRKVWSPQPGQQIDQRAWRRREQEEMEEQRQEEEGDGRWEATIW